MEICRVEDLTFRYPLREEPAVDGVSFSVQEGEFMVVCGASGCGKTTLLRLLKRELAPHGDIRGEILYRGMPQAALDPRTAAGEIGFVLQDPDAQIVTDQVWHELAFGLESLGLPTGVIRRRVGEMASYFGIQDWFHRDTDSLSGGQKQLLNLASVMVMQPRLLILDEPTSQLDPIAAADFIATLQRLNRELGLTVILAEHRLEEVFPMADRVMLMEAGGIRYCGTPAGAGDTLAALPETHSLLRGLPSAVRIFRALGTQGPCPLSVREGRALLCRRYAPSDGEMEQTPPADGDRETKQEAPAGRAVLDMRDVWFRYEKDQPDVLRGTELQVHEGELFCLLGGNGTGKTTVLNLLAGLYHPGRGRVTVDGRPLREYKGQALYRRCLAYLPQNPQTLFIKESVGEDCADLLEALEIPRQKHGERIRAVAEQIGVTDLLDRHPYDLSGGEQQKCALAKILLSQPRILLMDEPTKGLDAGAKQALGDRLQALRREGMAVLMVTHDVEFAAEYADRCALFFDGEVLAADAPAAFFSRNSFYTTAANRMARDLWPQAVTCAQVVACARASEARL